MKTTLYARALNGKIKVWTIENYGNAILTTNGYFDGQRAHHSSPVTMASSHSEILSKIKKKKKEGYKDMGDILALMPNSSTITYDPDIVWLSANLPSSNLDDNYNLKPMKCQPFKKGKMKYPAIAQPKLNGVRATLRWETTIEGDGMFKTKVSRAVLRSKSGLEYHFPHITDKLDYNYFIDYDSGIEVTYDGELYLHNTPLNIINSACPLINDRGTIAKTSNPGIYSLIQFVIFDTAIEDIPQNNRIGLIKSLPSKTNLIKSLSSIIVHNDDEVAEYTIKCITNGYEGAVVRNMDAEYAFGSRPMTIMKSKHFMDAEFEIIDIIAKGELSIDVPYEIQAILNDDISKETREDLLRVYGTKSDGSNIIFVLKNDINEESFECTPMYPHDKRIEMLNSKQGYIGKFATVKFYERSGVKQVPFNANVVTIRDYE